MSTGAGRSRVAGLILAAGASTRMGRTKQLLPYRGKPLLQHTVDTAAGVLDEVVLVLGHAAEEILAALVLPPGVRPVRNPDFASGQSASLRVGLAALDEEVEGALLLLGDQPDLSPAAIVALLDRFPRGCREVIRAQYGEEPGHPVLLPRSVWEEVTERQGDQGARGWIAAHPDRILHLPIAGDPPREVDTEEDYRRLLAESPPGAFADPE